MDLSLVSTILWLFEQASKVATHDQARPIFRTLDDEVRSREEAGRVLRTVVTTIGVGSAEPKHKRDFNPVEQAATV